MTNSPVAQSSNQVSVSSQQSESISADALASSQPHGGFILVVGLVRQAFRESSDGFLAVWAHEMDNKFGRSVVVWAWDIFIAIALPILSFLWLGIIAIFRFVRKPETREFFVAQYRRAIAWWSSQSSSESDQENARLSAGIEGS